MLTDRCTHLMAVAVSRGFLEVEISFFILFLFRVDEAWISPQPYLLFTYLNQVFIHFVFSFYNLDFVSNSF